MSYSAPSLQSESSTDFIDDISQKVSRLIQGLLVRGSKLSITRQQLPKWVWEHLGHELFLSNIDFTPLINIAGQKPCHREVLFKSDAFALVAIVLSPGQSTATHDHSVDCGPLLVHGHISEMYGYSDHLANNKIKLALLPHRRELKKYEPAEYYSAQGQNTHRLTEATGKAPAIVINLYLDKEGNSIKHRYPFYLGTDPESGTEWWINDKV